MVTPIEMLEKTNIKQHQTMENKINEIVDVVNSQGLENIKDTVNDVKARVGVLETENDTQDTEISQLGTRVSAVEKKNSTQDMQISEVTARVTAVESKNATQDQAISALETDKADSADVTALGNRVTAVEGDVSDLETGTVKTTGNQTIAGTKTFTNYPIVTNAWVLLSRNENYTIGSDTDYTARHIRFVDANGDLMTTLRSEASGNAAAASRINDTVLCDYGPNGKTCELRLRITDSGEAQALLTPPAVNCKDNQIATAGWVNDKIDGKADASALTAEMQAREQADAALQSGKLDKNQGSVNAGKALIVGSDGTVAPGDVGGGGGTAITTFQFNGARDTDDFNKLRDWINAVGTYKQISANIGSSNGAYTVRLSMGNSGKSGALFYGGGSFYANGPPFYPLSDCTFRVTNEDTITVTAYYISADGTRIGHNFSVKSSSYIDGSAFVI